MEKESHLLDGQLHGVLCTWHKNGQLATETPYVHGLLHGVCRQWSETGEPLGSFVMEHGTGIQKQWFDNGRLALE
jgi:antitoxin component YwqK of YwqJK toxin-antitoxin module